MNLDEAIDRYTNNAEYERTHGSLHGCLEFRQLAEWLKDYKRLLEQQPTTTTNNNEPITVIYPTIVCDDAISREDAEQMFRNIRCHLKPQDYKSAEEFNTRDLMLLNAEQMIHALPSVTQKSGKWIEHPEIETSAPEYLMFYECSECGDKQCFCKSDIHKKHFCNNCGARMVEPQESEDKE